MVRVHFGPPLQLNTLWGVSSAGRAPALQAGGHRFDPGTLHHSNWELRMESWGLRNWLKFQRNLKLHWVPWKRNSNAPWKLNIESIMMQLWEQQLREIFYNWVIKIQFCKYLLLMSLHNSTNLRTNIGLFSVSWTDHPGGRILVDWGQANKSARGMPWH